MHKLPKHQPNQGPGNWEKGMKVGWQIKEEVVIREKKGKGQGKGDFVVLDELKTFGAGCDFVN